MKPAPSRGLARAARPAGSGFTRERLLCGIRCCFTFREGGQAGLRSQMRKGLPRKLAMQTGLQMGIVIRVSAGVCSRCCLRRGIPWAAERALGFRICFQIGYELQIFLQIHIGYFPRIQIRHLLPVSLSLSFFLHSQFWVEASHFHYHHKGEMSRPKLDS